MAATMSNNSSFTGKFINNERPAITFFFAQHGGHSGSRKVVTDKGETRIMFSCMDGTAVWASEKATEKLLNKTRPAKELVVGEWRDDETGKTGFTAYYEGGEEIEISFE